MFVASDFTEGEELAVGVTEANALTYGKGGVELFLIDLTAAPTESLEKFGQTDRGKGIKEPFGWNEASEALLLGHLLQFGNRFGVGDGKSARFGTTEGAHGTSATEGGADVGAKCADIGARGAMNLQLIGIYPIGGGAG